MLSLMAILGNKWVTIKFSTSSMELFPCAFDSFNDNKASVMMCTAATSGGGSADTVVENALKKQKLIL